MKRLALLPLCAVALALTGCYDDQVPYAQAPPPPPAVYAPSPQQLDQASRNGFRAGEEDGSRDAYNGAPFSARRTQAYHDTPGYDDSVGPFEPYQNTFRNAYLRGYDRGFYHR